MHSDGINWEGGQVEVTRGVSGWEIQHRVKLGSAFSVDWQRHKTDAVRVAKTIADQRNARLMVQA